MIIYYSIINQGFPLSGRKMILGFWITEEQQENSGPQVDLICLTAIEFFVICWEWSSVIFIQHVRKAVLFLSIFCSIVRQFSRAMLLRSSGA
ncbi:hypothetical protein ACLB2K_031643 [Fragaria x ananassa]